MSVRRHVACTITGLVLALGALLPATGAANSTEPQRASLYGASGQAATPQQTALAMRIGRPDSLDELVSRLLTAIADLSDYDLHDQQPKITRVALVDLHRKLCGGTCTVRAAYVPGEGLYLDETLRPDLNAYHQSILFHELVHHVQEEQGSHAELDDCNRWRLREIEAYRLQNRFLTALGAHTHVMNPGIPCAADTTQAYREAQH